jgi:hypothetical protein
MSNHPIFSRPELGFELGRDYARYGLAPPASHRVPGHPVCEGWASGLPRTLRASPAVHHWLRLRLAAWLHGESVDLSTLTPDVLAQITPRLHPEGSSYCPITRCALRGIDTQPRETTAHDAQIVRVNPELPWSGSNVMVLGRNAAEALAMLPLQAKQRLRHALTIVQDIKKTKDPQRGKLLVHGLHGAQWARLGVVLSLVTPLQHAQAAGLPMLVLPPHQLQSINPVQELQALLSAQWLSPGWSRRRQQIEVLMDRPQPYRALRRFLDLFVQRLLHAARPEQPLLWRWAIEDTWRHADILLHWQRFALQIDANDVLKIKNHANLTFDTHLNHSNQGYLWNASYTSPSLLSTPCAAP